MHESCPRRSLRTSHSIRKSWYIILKEYRKYFTRFLLLLLLLSLLLTGCGSGNPVTEWKLFRSEFAGIREFFTLIPVASEESSPGIAASRDRTTSPILKTVRHKENLPSAYVPEVVYTAAEDTEKLGYTVVPHFSSNDAESVRAALAIHGIEPQIVTRRNPAPENHVYAIEYAGFPDADAYYINPACAVTLYVSAAKPVQPAAEADGSNVVYLTYDDGPTYTETIRLLDVLDTYGVKATFFVTGESVQNYPASAKAIVDRGHQIGCHSVTHIYDKLYASTEALEEELLWWEEIVTAAGITLDDAHKLFRYPGGSNNAAIGGTDKGLAMTEMLASHAYRVYDWNVVTNDAVLYTAPYGTDTYDYIRDTFLSTFDAKAATGETPIIILMHETVPETIDLMPWMIETLIDRGYTFGTLDRIDPWMFGME